MPITAPNLDNRRYQELLDETLARVPVHTPEWTNFNKSDPGVTVVELFAFLTESLLYRANQIPERNRKRFLQLLGVPLQPASSAAGLVTVQNEKGAPQTVTLATGLEVRAGDVPFRTDQGLDVLPIEFGVYFKRKLETSTPDLRDYNKLLYASYGATVPTDFDLYETVPLDPRAASAINLGTDTVDRSLWIGLFARQSDGPDPTPDEPWREIRKAIATRTLSLGVVPSVDATAVDLTPAGKANLQDEPSLVFELPNVPENGKVQVDSNNQPAPRYIALHARTDIDLLSDPGVVQLTLPDLTGLGLWKDLDPLEDGVGDLPPAISDTKLAGRLITWIRMRCTVANRARILWAGGNAVSVTQLAQIVSEPLADGTGQPDQVRRLSHSPVLPSVRVLSILGNQSTPWKEIEDLLSAGPEVAKQDLRQLPGREVKNLNPTDVFSVDYEAGTLQFGDGIRGRRPPESAKLYATYEFSVGAAGNVGKDAINSAPSLPSGFKVTNPVRTWGGADAETQTEGEKQIRRYLQHRDRLVTAADFEAITYRAPGVDIGRVDVLPAFHPTLSPNEPGGAPGVVTLMVIPAHDLAQPDAPVPDRLFLNTLCQYLDPRRLVTTELVVCGPVYKPIWISVGIDVVAGKSIAEVVDAVKQQLKDFLAPVRLAELADATTLLTTPQQAAVDRGWPLRTAVTDRVLVAEVARVSGVSSVSDVFLAEGDNPAQPSVEMQGLELPRILGISVVVGEPVPIDALRGQQAITDTTQPAQPAKRVLPVPFVPEEC